MRSRYRATALVELSWMKSQGLHKLNWLKRMGYSRQPGFSLAIMWTCPSLNLSVVINSAVSLDTNLTEVTWVSMPYLRWVWIMTSKSYWQLVYVNDDVVLTANVHIDVVITGSFCGYLDSNYNESMLVSTSYWERVYVNGGFVFTASVNCDVILTSSLRECRRRNDNEPTWMTPLYLQREQISTLSLRPVYVDIYTLATASPCRFWRRTDSEFSKTRLHSYSECGSWRHIYSECGWSRHTYSALMCLATLAFVQLDHFQRFSYIVWLVYVWILLVIM